MLRLPVPDFGVPDVIVGRLRILGTAPRLAAGGETRVSAESGAAQFL